MSANAFSRSGQQLSESPSPRRDRRHDPTNEKGNADEYSVRPGKKVRVGNTEEASVPAALMLKADNWRDVLEHLDVHDIARLAKTCVFLRGVSIKDGQVVVTHLRIRPWNIRLDGPYDDSCRVAPSYAPDVLLAVHPATIKSADIWFDGSKDQTGASMNDAFSTVFPIFVAILSSFRGLEKLTLNASVLATCSFEHVGANMKRLGDILASLPTLREVDIYNSLEAGPEEFSITYYNIALMAALAKMMCRTQLQVLVLDCGCEPSCVDGSLEVEQANIAFVRSVFNASNLSRISLVVGGPLLREFCSQAKSCHGANLRNLKSLELYLENDVLNEEDVVRPEEIDHLLSFVGSCNQIEHLSLRSEEDIIEANATTGWYFKRLQCIFRSLSALKSVSISVGYSCENYNIGSFLAEQAMQDRWECFAATGIYLRPEVAKKLEQCGLRRVHQVNSTTSCFTILS